MTSKETIENPVLKIEDDRTGLEFETLQRAFLDNLFYVQGKRPENATKNDLYFAIAYTIRDRIMHRWLNSNKSYAQNDARAVGYLSAEFLMGPQLGNNLINLGLYKLVQQVFDSFGLDIDEILDQEEEPGLGNGGLGRLAACFLDSMATLNIPAVGYGIRYEFGIFDQEIKDGWQVEITDKWLKFGNPWEIPRNEASVKVKFGGHTTTYHDEEGNYRVAWHPNQVVLAIPYDTLILGYQTNNTAVLRLWKSEASESFYFQEYNRGNYYGAVEEKVTSENITKVLYPNDEQESGKTLRLMQQYFFVSATLQDTIRFHLTVRNHPLEIFHEKIILQLNDTHPAIAIAEMMRLLVDEHHMDWDKAWFITTSTFAYTNHTLLPEALETWPVAKMEYTLPRLMEIILEINYHFLEEVSQKFPNDPARIERMSIIGEGEVRHVRMAHLAIAGSYAVNGVAQLHTELLISKVLVDFYEMWPEKFSNKTNGITPRRWLLLNNPSLAELINAKIGVNWAIDLHVLKKLEKYVDNKTFQKQWQKAKHTAKVRLAKKIKKNLDIEVDPNSLFDIQVKRIHEYKRQHLNILHIITLYNRIKANPAIDIVPRTFIFGGKAAPGYHMAKLIIKLINAVGEVVNKDPDVNGRLKVIFIPDYNVKNSQEVYPAADLSEQISTAGKEASGTGNMKFTMNGALTIGTMDGANIEIREEVGEENFFLFGLTAKEVFELKSGFYDTYRIYEENESLKQCLDMISSGYFSMDEPGRFHLLVDSLKYDDPYVLLADYQSYIDCQDRVNECFRDQTKWTRMSIVNSARCGKFSSDRTIKEYCEEIWKVSPVKVKIPEYDPKDIENVKF